LRQPEAEDYEAALLELSALRYPSQDMAAEGTAYHGIATTARFQFDLFRKSAN